jgi:hypothetical protein
MSFSPYFCNSLKKMDIFIYFRHTQPSVSNEAIADKYLCGVPYSLWTSEMPTHFLRAFMNHIAPQNSRNGFCYS